MSILDEEKIYYSHIRYSLPKNHRDDPDRPSNHGLQSHSHGFQESKLNAWRKEQDDIDVEDEHFICSSCDVPYCEKFLLKVQLINVYPLHLCLKMKKEKVTV